MQKVVRILWCCLAVGPVLHLAAAPAAAQVELDRIVSRVNGRIITQSDIRQARLLKLVDDASSDEATRRALENRLLILNEMNRAAPLGAITEAEISARRNEWRASLGPGTDVDGLAASVGMSASELEMWPRDDLRIRAYLRRQFGMLPDQDRARATEDWLNRLRQRADLR